MNLPKHIPAAFALFLLIAGCTENQNQTDMETQVKAEVAKTQTAISKDGTIIAYEKIGKGLGVILVNGALAHRNLNGERELAEMLANHFTVIFYDRRGRGESSDTEPYAVDREIDDIEALVNEVGGRVYLYGSSGGAALALLTAAMLGPQKVSRLALYELPYGSDSVDEYAKEKNKISELIQNNKSGDAVAYFLSRRGMPDEQLGKTKNSPEWEEMERVGHTLVYDFEVLGDGSVPADIAKNIQIPTLVMAGEKSFEFMHTTADSVSKIIPGAERKTLKNQTHDISPEALAPVLKEFFRNRN